MERKYGKNIVKRDNLTEHDENIKTTIEGYTKEKALVQKSNALRKLQLILRNEVSGIEVIENEYQCWLTIEFTIYKFSNKTLLTTKQYYADTVSLLTRLHDETPFLIPKHSINNQWSINWDEHETSTLIYFTVTQIQLKVI